jgi:hypothetical protein
MGSIMSHSMLQCQHARLTALVAPHADNSRLDNSTFEKSRHRADRNVRAVTSPQGVDQEADN